MFYVAFVELTFFNLQFLLEQKIELSVTPIACS